MKKSPLAIKQWALRTWCPLSDSNRPPTDYKSV